MAKGRLAILTSGGDAPGMNSCIRSIVRSAIYHGVEVFGVRHGYQGLISGHLFPLSLRSVGNIIQRGGTILGSSRSKEFRTKKGRAEAIRELESLEVDKLIVLGGDGSMAGASVLAKEMKINVVGVPCTIDNDIPHTDFCIGFDSAIQTAVECIDKVRDTADSHGRIFVVEVMGKDTGHLAVETGLAGGAEFVVTPESGYRTTELVKKIKAGIQRGKTGSIVVVAEKKQPGTAFKISEMLQEHVKREVKTLVLGHLQRGGSPSPMDRNLASQFGALAVELSLGSKNRQMTAIQGQKLCSVPFSKVIGRKKKLAKEKLALIDRLSI